jgi:hypothetical protein
MNKFKLFAILNCVIGAFSKPTKENVVGQKSLINRVCGDGMISLCIISYLGASTMFAIFCWFCLKCFFICSAKNEKKNFFDGNLNIELEALQPHCIEYQPDDDQDLVRRLKVLKGEVEESNQEVNPNLDAEIKILVTEARDESLNYKKVRFTGIDKEEEFILRELTSFKQK